MVQLLLNEVSFKGDNYIYIDTDINELDCLMFWYIFPQNNVVGMLQRYLHANFPRAKADNFQRSLLQCLKDLRELTTIKKRRELAPNVKKWLFFCSQLLPFILSVWYLLNSNRKLCKAFISCVQECVLKNVAAINSKTMKY